MLGRYNKIVDKDIYFGYDKNPSLNCFREILNVIANKKKNTGGQKMYQTDFTLEEFSTRRKKLCEAMEDNAFALLQGAPGPMGSDSFYQYKDFYYLCGIETPRAYLLIEGRNGHTTAFLPHISQVEQQSTKPVACFENADLVCKLSGVDAVLGWEDLGQYLNRASTIYMPFEDGEIRTVNRHHAKSWAIKQSADPWDTRITRAAQFIETVKRQFPNVKVKNLSPLMDEMRVIKSPAEIELLKEAGHLTALGIIEAMRSTLPGVMEYQLDAVMLYYYLAGGSKDRGYHAIIAGGENAFYGHYCENDCQLNDGDIVLVDCAPDYHYYTSDIGRMWPVNGVYSNAQKAIYGFVVEYHKVLLDLIGPGRMVADIHKEAAEKMGDVLENWDFATPDHKEAAGAMFNFGGHISHCVGLTVHDGGLHYSRPLEPGMVFTVDPQFRLPEEKLYYRVEDTIVITEDGIENFTAEAPLEIEDVESLMKEKGLLQEFPEK
ncbi:M24 family metallopeptidase [Candidatus Poribacteria bacterium]|nr:M24 family metallopeptidase [Candidatus Poribacteria bacterium]